jgi:hypothetical protein
MRVFDAVVFAHFLPGAFAVLALFRRRGWHPAGAVLAAMIFILGGSASARLQHTGMIISYGFFPLALVILEEALDRRSYRLGALFAVVAAITTVGRDQVAFLCAVTLLGVVVDRVLRAEDRVGYLRQRLGLLAAMGVIGGGLLAVPSLLTMQFLATSTRPSFGFGVAAMGSLPPESLATALFGNVFGSLRASNDYWGPGWPTLPEGTWTDRAINYLFAGTIPALLLLWHGIAGGRLFAREFRFFFAVLALALFYALGRYTPIFSLVFDHVPGIALYRRPADATFLVNIGFAMASGYLLHRYLRDGAPRLVSLPAPLRAALPALAIILVGGACAAALVFAIPAGMISPAATEMGFGLAVAAGAAALLVRFSGTPVLRVAVASLAVAFTGGELVWRNAGSALNAEPTQRYAVFQQLPPEQVQGLQALKQELAERNAKGERPRVEILGLGGAWQNASMVLGLEDTIGYNPLRLADYERAIGPGENAADPNLRQFPSLFRGYRCKLASLLGLEYLVLDRPAEKLPRHFPRLTDAKLLYGSGTMWVYRLNASAPRAYLATRLVPVDSEAVLGQDELPEFDRSRTALLDQSSVPLLKAVDATADTTSEPEAPANGSVAIRVYRRNAVTLDVDTDRPSVVVLHDIYYPGWEAYVDGKIQPILRTNLLFRGVEVSAGQHTVEFRFRPLSVDNLMAAATELMTRDGGERDDTAVQ